MTPEEPQALRDANSPTVHALFSAYCYVGWSWKGCGFGQLSIDFEPDTGKPEIMNERMTRDSVRKILHAMADFVADRAVLSDNPEDIPPIDFIAEQKASQLEYDEQERIHGRI